MSFKNHRREAAAYKGGNSSGGVVFKTLVLCLTCFAVYHTWKGALPVIATESTTSAAASATTELCDPNIIYRGPVGLPPLRTRDDLGKLCQVRGFTDGIEVGVQLGYSAAATLRNWPSCQSFKLVDLWAHQENYKDNANVNNTLHEEYFQITQKRLSRWASKLEYFRMYSTEAAAKIPDQSLDYVYVDARHDYCGVSEDLNAYWPKVRPGGIMAGHDYMDQEEVKRASPQQDWSLCMDGTVNTGAVKAAVQDFAERHALTISVMYTERNFASWMVQKPTRLECVQQLGQFALQNFTSVSPS